MVATLSFVVVEVEVCKLGWVIHPLHPSPYMSCVCVCGVVRGCRVVGGDAHPSVLICRGWLQSARLPCHLRAARNVSSAPELLSQLRNTDWKQIYTSMEKP